MENQDKPISKWPFYWRFARAALITFVVINVGSWLITTLSR